MFIVEGAAGWWGESTGLLADSLDMLADASVYGVALCAVGRSHRLQVRSAVASGLMQMALGLGVLCEVIRRFAFGSEPVSVLMLTVGSAALAANISCLCLLAKHRKGGVHMRASWIFSTNDVLANLGVIASGLLVMWLGNRYPDLLVGTVISVVVFGGGCRILRDSIGACNVSQCGASSSEGGK
jgi:Co/Zn/Cd efflux system component